MKDRLILFLRHKNLSQNKFEKMVGLSNGFVNNIGDSIRLISLQKIIRHFPELNKNWILTGEGSMLISENTMQEPNENYKSQQSQLSKRIEELTKEIQNWKERFFLQQETLRQIEERIKDKDLIINEKERTIQILLN